MNEVTTIHLGRQAFTIAADAHAELRDYLHDITKQVGDSEVASEVELRMAELLTDRGITSDKVILPVDVAYLKEQLGEPTDFRQDETASDATEPATQSRKLFRDTEHGMFAGVAAGLAAYLGLDVWLVRIVFLIAAIAGGFGVPIYLVLWLLVPEAKTSSDRLQMAGKAVTVDSLKEFVERADIKGAAQRANDTLSGPAARLRDVVNAAFRILVKLVGIGLTLFGVVLLAGVTFTALYLLAHGNVIDDGLFPIGFKEHLLTYIAAAVAVMAGLFMVLFGLAVYRRKWPIRAWLTGVLAGLTIIATVAGASLAADAAPHVRDRYRANYLTLVKHEPAFSDVVQNGPAIVATQHADTYYVVIRYYKHTDPSKIHLSVQNGNLVVDTSGYQWDRHCSSLCIPNHYDPEITVYYPYGDSVSTPPLPVQPVSPDKLQLR